MSSEQRSFADPDQHRIFHQPSIPDQHNAQSFVFDYVTYSDELPPGQRWSTWLEVEPLSRGPEPWPDWVVTSEGAIDTELGILKTGKEADVFLLDRTDLQDPTQSVVMAAKRYRSSEHRSFQRAAAYTEGRSMRRSRDERAVKRKSTFGREVAAAEWAVSEWSALNRCWLLGLPVPYPVQIDGTEILMEWITGPDGQTAPRLAQTRPEPVLLASYFEQLRESMVLLVQAGLVHGDLSPYNILAEGDRVVIIDLPQLVDLAGNQQSFDFLHRDCTNLGTWFTRRGLDVDADELFAELLAHAF